MFIYLLSYLHFYFIFFLSFFWEPFLENVLPQTLFRLWSQYCVWTEGPFKICIKTLGKKNGPINQWNRMSSLFCKSSTEISDRENGERERSAVESAVLWNVVFPELCILIGRASLHVREPFVSLRTPRLCFLILLCWFSLSNLSLIYNAPPGSRWAS